MFTTKNFAKELYKKTFTREKFISAAVASGANKVCAGTRFFPERAMYWTRMFRADAADAGLTLEAIIVESELVTEDPDVLAASKGDLLEWIRIAALSYIPKLRIHIDGTGEVDEAYMDSLAVSLQSVITSAEMYGTQLVFSAGTAKISDDLLLALVKKLGFTACRIASNTISNPNDRAWAVEPE